MFVVLPVVPLVGNICTVGTNGITIFTICTIFYLNVAILVIKLLQMVKMLPTNSTIGETRTYVSFNHFFFCSQSSLLISLCIECLYHNAKCFGTVATTDKASIERLQLYSSLKNNCVHF